MGVCLSCHLKDAEADIAYDLNLNCTINKIKNKHGVEHATEENANSIIVFKLLLNKIKNTKDEDEIDLIEKIYDRIAIVMMPLGLTDFGIFQAFNGIIHHPVFQSCDGYSWIKTRKVPMPPLLIFYQFFDEKSKQYSIENSNNSIFQGQIRAEVLHDKKTIETYVATTGKHKDNNESSFDPEFVQFVSDNWNKIGIEWYNEKLTEITNSLKSFTVSSLEI